MAKLIPWLVLACICIQGSACVVTPAHRREKTVVVTERSCHPSQYWDGSQCRHKGKGHGARKHDDR